MPNDTTPPWLLPAILIGFPLVFVPFWCFVCWLLSQMGGWGRIAARFPGSPNPDGPTFSMQSGRVGMTNYRSVLTIRPAPDGLHLAIMAIFRVGHPPLFIPWHEIRNARRRQILWMETISFDVSAPAIGRISLPAKVFAGQPIQLADSPVPPPPG